MLHLSHQDAHHRARCCAARQAGDRDVEMPPLFPLLNCDSPTGEAMVSQSTFFRNRRAEIRPKVRWLPTDRPHGHLSLSQLSGKIRWK